MSAGCIWPVGTSAAVFTLIAAGSVPTTAGSGSSGDAPLPLWALAALGVMLLALVSLSRRGVQA